MPDDPNKPDFSDVVSGSSSSAPSPSEAQGGNAGANTDRMYVVQSGDSLSKIFEANRDLVKNPDLIQPGWRLRIPD